MAEQQAGAARQAPVIAVDGPAGVGKSTVSRQLAQQLGWRHLDSGQLYRAVAHSALAQGIALDDEERLLPLVALLQICEGRLRLAGAPLAAPLGGEKLGRAASRIAVLPRLRKALLPVQRTSREMPGLVAEGRDMGSVVFPDAELKVFLDASLEERSRRRREQLKNTTDSGNFASSEQLQRNLARRDAMDEERAVAPLLRVSDSVLLDTSALDARAVVAWIVGQARQRELL